MTQVLRRIMNSLAFHIFLISLVAPAVIQCISVIGPRVIRPYSAYRVAVAGGPRAQTVYVAVDGRKANGEPYSQGREVQVQAASSRIVDLEIDDPGPGNYELIAQSRSGAQFSSSARLVYQPRSFCVFVQTDKRVYQPGDTIKFRVVALDKYLLPLSVPIDVSVMDAGGFPVRQWGAVSLDRGILSEELVLADEPALGEWTIQVEVRNQVYSRQILVADYVMPKFQMDMQLPKEVLFNAGRFTVNVTANHFTGLPVQGELTLSAYAVFFSDILQPVFSNPARKVVDFNGNTEVAYDLKTDLDLAEDAARPLVVEAVLEEKDTLIRQNVSSRILLLRTPYRLKVTAPEYFRPMLPYTIQIEVVGPSGQIIELDDDVRVERLWDDGAPVNVTTVPLKKGLATYTLTPAESYAAFTLNLVIKYKEVTERVINVIKSAGSKGQYLTVELLTRDTSVGGELRARISSTEQMDLLHYAVIGRGDILLAKTVELSPARKSVDVSIPVQARMAPGCVLLAWYPLLDSTQDVLLASAIYAPQKNLLQHKVYLSVGGGYRPGGAVEMKVVGEPGAHAAVLAEDSRAALAGLSGEDGLGSGLDMHTIEREVESFSGLRHSIFKNQDHLPGMGVDLGGNATFDVFTNAGMVILTDGFVMRSDPRGKPPPLSLPETGTRPPLAGPYAFSRLPTPPTPRYYLNLAPQPTWTVANFSIDNDGRGSQNRVSPSTSGNWLVGAFAVHPELGLGLASPQKFTTSIPLTITAELPASLQRGEALAAVITLKSTLTVDTSVEVTFHNSEQYFEFEPLENNIDSAKKIEVYRRLRVSVPAGGSASTAFLVSATRLGEAPIIVEATGDGVSASLFRTIDVKDGYEEEISSWGLIDGRRGVARANVTLEPPPGTRAGPVSLLAAGNLLAAALARARTAPAPAADPVYALRPMAVACVLLDYLQAIDEDDSAVTSEARAHAAAGYQRLMAYRQPDGSFAPDTDDESTGDVWMTAVAARWLVRCARHVAVGPEAATAAIRWLAGAQGPGGSFRAPDQRLNQHAQGALPTAAYALLAFTQAQGNDIFLRRAVQQTSDYVAGSLSPEQDAYSLAVSAGALAAARHPQAATALEMMDRYANASGSTKFWSRKMTGNEWRNPWLKGNSLEASTAAWGLRAMLSERLVDEAVPVARYLMQAQSDLDPDVLDALAMFAKEIRSPSKLRLSVNVTGSEEARQFNIDDENALVIQTQLVRAARSASAVTEGRGIAILGLSTKGSTNVTAAWPRFNLDPRVDQVSTKDRLQLSICIGFVALGNETESGLTLMTVRLPSGYLADIHTLTELTAASHVTTARLSEGGAVVLAWLRAGRAERCATLAAPRARAVARQRPGVATLKDLYDSSHRARVFFQPITTHACDVCRAWESCSSACGSVSAQRADGGDVAKPRSSPDAAATHVLAPAIVVLATLLFTLL
ncbi:thioester-containing protein 1 allele R1-like [Cydia strobilella]|uniref:thioester-containing protein 1 allele R1-like n=1 Tax=Cydia strobilella TaxID=1100964 RepID=UPI0030068B8C